MIMTAPSPRQQCPALAPSAPADAARLHPIRDLLVLHQILHMDMTRPDKDHGVAVSQRAGAAGLAVAPILI